MLNNYLLYRITSPSNKEYIGVTNSINRRIREHYSDWKNRCQNIALHNSFSKYGFDSHTFEVIINKLNKSLAYNLEKNVVNENIKHNKELSLNSRTGGLGGNMIDWKSEKGKIAIKKIKETQKAKYEMHWESKLPFILEHKKTKTINQLCELLNVSSTALTNYLKYKNIKVERKSRFNIFDISKEIKPYYELGYTNAMVMGKTGYSKGTICRAKNLLKGE
jgi:predicted GIY-YIG superfamily endonuclease